MRKSALVITLVPLLAACQNFGWNGQGGTLSPEQKARGLMDVHALSSKHETETFFRGVRRRSDGLNNAFGRDLAAIQGFWDRYFWNYDANDPYVNFPSDTTRLEHIGRFGLSTVSSLHVVDDVTRR
ncbi:MAG: hypothetical protein Fur0037_24440 [Planctomycetota bacterium]